MGTEDGSLYVYRLTSAAVEPATREARRYVNAKVVLLGEGAVGKTSLAHRLIEDKYVIRDRTHGMNVWRLELPLTPDATLEREALLWDLAGQEDHRLIHQLFLGETALALLLINPQKDDPFAEAGDWLKALKTAASSHVLFAKPSGDKENGTRDHLYIRQRDREVFCPAEVSDVPNEQVPSSGSNGADIYQHTGAATEPHTSGVYGEHCRGKRAGKRSRSWTAGENLRCGEGCVG